MENQKVHFRHIMLWEFKQGTSGTAAAKKICDTYGEGVVSERTVRNWFLKFRSGDETLEDEPRAGRPCEFNEDVLKELLEQNPRQSTRELSRKLNMSQSTLCRHLEKLGKGVTKTKKKQVKHERNSKQTA